MAYLWSLVAGILLALPFKFPQLALISWISLIPYLIIRTDKSNKQSFLLGWLLGIGFLGISSYWLIHPVLNFSGYPWPIAGLIVGLALGLLALYFGLFSLSVNVVTNYLSWPLFVIVPLIWTAVEVVRTFFSFQFLFGFIGYTQSFIPQLIQLAEYGGVYLISFLIIMVNTLLYQAFTAYKYKLKITYLVVSIIILGLMFGYGQGQIRSAASQNTKEITVTAVQPSIPQHIKLNSSYETHIANKLQKLSNQELKRSIHKQRDLLIWPETAVLRSYDQNKKFPYQLNKSVPMLVGGFIRRQGDLLNSSLLIDKNRNIIASYSKNKLVPWGEYVPFPKLVPDFIETNLNHITPGSKLKNFNFKGIDFITPICSEILNPFYLRKLYTKDDLIINISNEAWFATSNAPLQVLQAAIFRAVETKTPVVKVGNTGISGVVNSQGKVLVRTKLFRETAFSYTISLSKETESWFLKGGTLFSWGVVGVAVCLLLISCWKPKESSK